MRGSGTGESAGQPGESTAAGEDRKVHIGRRREQGSRSAPERYRIEEMHHVQPATQTRDIDPSIGEPFRDVGMPEGSTEGDEEVDAIVEFGEQIEGDDGTEGMSDEDDGCGVGIGGACLHRTVQTGVHVFKNAST